MRISAVKMFGFPVQCVVALSVKRSAADQMLKYGSWATSGTAGGRRYGRVWGRARKVNAANAAASRRLLMHLHSAPVAAPDQSTATCTPTEHPARRRRGRS